MVAWSGRPNICTNSKCQFIVGDELDKNIKVFDCNGNFLYLLSATLRNTIICDVATDQADNIYVLCQKRDPLEHQVRIFDKDNKMPRDRCFGFDDIVPSHLSIVEMKSKPVSKKVFVLGPCSTTGFGVRVTEISDSFLQGEEVVWYGCHGFRIQSVTVCDNGNVVAVVVPESAPSVHRYAEVHFFTAEGDFLHKFNIVPKRSRSGELMVAATHWANEHLIIVSIPISIFFPRASCLSSSWDIDVSIYKEDGKLVNHFSIMSCYELSRINSITMNRQGRIALAMLSFGKKKDEILVF